MVSRSPFQPLRVRDSVTAAAGASLSRSRYTNFPPFPVTPPLLLCAAPLHSQYSRQEAEQTQQAAQPQPPQPPARRGQPRACSASAAPRPASRRAQRRPLPAAQASPTRHAAELGAGPALAAVPAEGRRWGRTVVRRGLGMVQDPRGQLVAELLLRAGAAGGIVCLCSRAFVE